MAVLIKVRVIPEVKKLLSCLLLHDWIQVDKIKFIGTGELLDQLHKVVPVQFRKAFKLLSVNPGS